MSRRKRSRLTGANKAERRGEQACQKPNKEQLAIMLDWLLPDGSIFFKMRLHGNAKWLPKQLVCLALFWAWAESKHLTDAYAEATQCCQSLFQSCVLGTYQGFRTCKNPTQGIENGLSAVGDGRNQAVGCVALAGITRGQRSSFQPYACSACGASLHRS